MADNYEILGSVPVTVDTGNGRTETQEQYAVKTLPSEVVFRFRLPLVSDTATVVAGEADQWATAFEQKLLVSGVAGISTYQDVNNSGTVVEQMDVTVASDDGRLTSELTIPQSQLQSGTFNAKVEAERERLNAIASL